MPPLGRGEGTARLADSDPPPRQGESLLGAASAMPHLNFLGVRASPQLFVYVPHLNRKS